MDFLALFGESAKKSPHLNVVFFCGDGGSKKIWELAKKFGVAKNFVGAGDSKKKVGVGATKKFGGRGTKNN